MNVYWCIHIGLFTLDVHKKHTGVLVVLRACSVRVVPLSPQIIHLMEEDAGLDPVV